MLKLFTQIVLKWFSWWKFSSTVCWRLGRGAWSRPCLYPCLCPFLCPYPYRSLFLFWKNDIDLNKLHKNLKHVRIWWASMLLLFSVLCWANSKFKSDVTLRNLIKRQGVTKFHNFVKRNCVKRYKRNYLTRCSRSFYKIPPST